MIRAEVSSFSAPRITSTGTACPSLDAFDFTMLLFLIPHLKELFQVTLPQMALVVTATGLAKVVGAVGWGWAADRFGRKLPFIAAILWFFYNAQPHPLGTLGYDYLHEFPNYPAVMPRDNNKSMVFGLSSHHGAM